MADTKLDIVIQVQDQASAAMSAVSSNFTKNFGDMQKQANEVALTFGATGAAILAPLGLMAEGAAIDEAAFQSLKTTIQAAIDSATADADSTGALTKQKALLEGQLSSVTAKIEDYTQKSESGKGATGQYTDALQKLQQQADGLRDKLGLLNTQQALVGQSADDITAKFNAAAKANTDLGFVDEDSIASFNKLFAATGSVTDSLTFNTLAMDLARKAHIDLGTATTQVILATEGNGRALKQYGINLKDGLTPLEAVSQLQEKLKGQAVDFTKTLQGQMAVTKAKTDELSDSLGAHLIPALESALSALVPIIERLSAWIEEHPRLTSAILIGVAALGFLLAGVAAIAGAVSGVIQLWKAGAAAVSLFGVALDFVAANPIVLIIAAIVALAIGIYELIVHWQAVRDFTLKIWNDIVAFITGHWKTIVSTLMPGMKNLVAFFTAALGEIGSVWNATWTAMSSFVMGIWDGIKYGITSAISFVQGTMQSFTSWAQGILGPILGAINSVGSAASNFGKGVSNAVGGALNIIGIHDAIITPSGQIIQSDPQDFLIATKTPGSLIGGAGSSINIYIQGGNYLDSQGAVMIANQIAKQITQQIKTRNYAT